MYRYQGNFKFARSNAFVNISIIQSHYLTAITFFATKAGLGCARHAIT